jgi:5-methylcytosine-specific restriction protein A
MCERRGKISAASVVDHIDPHGGDWTKFCCGEVQSLCKACHDSLKRFVEGRGYLPDIGLDGAPVDTRHPCYAARVEVG